jgi:hypothetical protein
MARSSGGDADKGSINRIGWELMSVSFRESRISASQIRQALTILMPELERFWQRPLLDYAHAVYDDVHRGQCSVRNDAMGRLQLLVRDVAIRAGVDEDHALDAARQVSEMPVLQTGPHCFLIVDPEAFYTHLFSALGLSSHKRRWHLYFGCSTVKFTEKPRKGPGWLDVGGELVNVFGLSKRRMGSINLCGRNGPYHLELRSETVSAANRNAEWLRNELPEAAFPTAADAIIAANRAIWRKSFPLSLQLLQFNDADVGDLVADHFEDPDSWLSRRFTGDDNAAEKMLATIDTLNQGPWGGWIRRTTDFFWGLLDGRIVPLHLDGGVLTGSTSSSFRIPLTPEHLARSLRRRELVPNLLMIALVTSILPGVRLLGGSRQTVYHPLMRYVVATALDVNHDRALLAAMREDRRAGMWGHRVLRPANAFPLQETEEVGHWLAVAAAYGEQPLEVAAGDLAFFAGDPIWREMYGHLASQRIATASPEWACA